MSFIERFLRAKHWQIFLLTFGITMVCEGALMVSVFSNIGANPDPLIVFRYFKFFPLLMLVVTGVTFGWQWSIAIGLQAKYQAA